VLVGPEILEVVVVAVDDPRVRLAVVGVDDDVDPAPVLVGDAVEDV
jgi:hypothetical protein